MKRGHYVLAAAGMTAAAAAATAWAMRQRSNSAPERRRAEAVTVLDGADGTEMGILPYVAGREESFDSLGGAEHGLTEADARTQRYQAKLGPGGKATSAERETMYDDLDGVGESGSMGSAPGREDQQPIVHSA